MPAPVILLRKSPESKSFKINSWEDWIKTQFENFFHTNLNSTDGSGIYNLGSKTKNRRLKTRPPQDLLLSDFSEDDD